MNRNVASIVHVESLDDRQRSACEQIVSELPAWFGNDDGIQAMRESLKQHSAMLAMHGEHIAGFLTIQQHFPECWEIAWMAVRPAMHRNGTGRLLVETLCRLAQERNVRLLQVKTLADAHPSPEYAGTRAFYANLGFLRLEVFPELWDPVNPCLVLVKPLPAGVQ